MAALSPPCCSCRATNSKLSIKRWIRWSSGNCKSTMEVNMMRRNLLLVIAFGLATLGSIAPAWSDDADQAALIKAIGGAKITLAQGIAQVAKGAEVPTEAKYEMEDGKLMLSVYTSAKGFDTAAGWAPKKEVFEDLKHIARSAQYHTLLSMTKVTIPAIIQKASAQGTVFSVKEKVRNGKPVFEVMTAQGNAAKTTYYDLMTGEAVGG